MTSHALVYGDIDLNLIDGSAIWLQSVTQALARTGCAVTLVLKAPVSTSRLIAPLLAEPGITVRRPFEEHLLEDLEGVKGPGPMRPATAIELLARLDAEQRHDLVVLRGFCGRVLWLDHGQVRRLGPAEAVIDEYTEYMRQGPGRAAWGCPTP